MPLENSTLITQASLKSQSAKDLSQLAKEKGVPGWHSMRKDDLVKALLKLARKKNAAKKIPVKATRSKSMAKVVDRKIKEVPKTKVTRGRKPKVKETPVVSRNPRVARKIRLAVEERERLRDLARSSSQNKGETTKDRLVLLVRDPYWLHAHWQITRQAVERVKVSMAENWHSATPVLRVFHIESSTTTSTSESIERDIEIHGGVSNWYIDVADAPKTFRVCIGYKTANGKFFPVVRSNKVTTPQPGNGADLDENWSDLAANCEKVYALSGGYHEDDSIMEVKEVLEERFQRPVGSQSVSRTPMGKPVWWKAALSGDSHETASDQVRWSSTPIILIVLIGVFRLRFPDPIRGCQACQGNRFANLRDDFILFIRDDVSRPMHRTICWGQVSADPVAEFLLHSRHSTKRACYGLWLSPTETRRLMEPSVLAVITTKPSSDHGWYSKVWSGRVRQ